MKITEHQSPVLVHSLEELTELYKAAGAVASQSFTVQTKPLFFYRDPQTRGIPDTDFVDQLHIRQHKNARLLIAVFPIDNTT
jgi:hypothetical protein